MGKVKTVFNNGWNYTVCRCKKFHSKLFVKTSLDFGSTTPTTVLTRVGKLRPVGSMHPVTRFHVAHVIILKYAHDRQKVKQPIVLRKQGTLFKNLWVGSAWGGEEGACLQLPLTMH